MLVDILDLGRVEGDAIDAVIVCHARQRERLQGRHVEAGLVAETPEADVREHVVGGMGNVVGVLVGDGVDGAEVEVLDHELEGLRGGEVVFGPEDLEAIERLVFGAVVVQQLSEVRRVVPEQVLLQAPVPLLAVEQVDGDGGGVGDVAA